jgi:hypothetical protein
LCVATVTGRCSIPPLESFAPLAKISFGERLGAGKSVFQSSS